MSISPHLVLETMQALSGHWDGWERTRLPALRPISAVLLSSTVFDFGRLMPDDEHVAFALDLYERGLFRLPYAFTAFHCSKRPENEAAQVNPAMARAASALIVLAQRPDDQRITAVQCIELRRPDGTTEGAVPMACILDASLATAGPASCDVTADVIPLLSDGLLMEMYGKAPADCHDIVRERMCQNLTWAMGYTVMLMSKGIITKHIPAPDKPNAARRRKGKPPIADRYVVSIDPSTARVIHTVDGEQSIDGHTRGSPRPHWRRGHFRTLDRGGERERVIPVAPALIAANESSPATRAVYRMRGG